MGDKLEQAIAEYLKEIKVKSGGIANLPLFKDFEVAAVSQGVAQAVRHLLATEPEALGLRQKSGREIGSYIGGWPESLYALPQEGEGTNG